MGDGPQLPALRADLKLIGGPRTREGAPTWTIHDPVANRFFRVGALEFEILSRWGLADTVAIAAAVSAETAFHAEADDVTAVASFLAAHRLLARTPGKPPPPVVAWRRLLGHYLFLRLPLLNPDMTLDRTLSWVEPVFHPRTRWLLAGGAFLALLLVARQWDSYAAQFNYFFDGWGIAFFAVAVSISKICHELGHAYTAKRFGLRVPTLGVALVLMWPMLYTDTTDAWRLQDRRARMLVDSAGVISELMLAVLASLGWAFVPDGLLRDALFYLSSTGWLLTLGVNLNPFVRFDGYYLLADALDTPNLQQRTYALARWWLRHALIGIDDAVPERLPRHTRYAWIAFALASWAYRLVLFLGIAVVVYNFFFKALGIVLFAVEVAWLVVRPVVGELKVWWTRRAEIRGGPRYGALRAGMMVLVLALLVPWRGHIDAPARVVAAHHARLYSPVPARVAAVHVAEGEVVQAGAPIVTLESPELDHRLRQTALRARALESQLAQLPASHLVREQGQVLTQQLAESLTELDGLREEKVRLAIAAPLDGTVRNLSEKLRPGTWVGSRDLLGRVVDPSAIAIESYVAERDIGSIEPGDSAHVYLDLPGSGGIAARVTEIAPHRVAELDYPEMGSVWGGPIAAVRDGRGRIVPHEALYRVRLEAKSPEPAPFIAAAGKTVIHGNPRSLLGGWAAYVMAVLLRESGF